MKHVPIKPVAERPRCLVCGRVLTPYTKSEVQTVAAEQVAAYRAGRIVLREDGAKLSLINSFGVGADEATAYFAVHTGTFGLDGRNAFHSQRCAVRYGQDAAELLPKLTYKTGDK